MAMMHIKRIQQHGSNNFAHTHALDPMGGVKRSKHFLLSESSHAAYQIKGTEAFNTMQVHVVNILSSLNWTRGVIQVPRTLLLKFSSKFGIMQMR